MKYSQPPAQAAAPFAPLPMEPVTDGRGVGRRLASSTLWLVLGAVVGQGSGVVASMVIARVLGQEGFGAYGVLMNTVATLGVFAGLGIGITATRYVARLRAVDPAGALAVIEFCSRAVWISSVATALLCMLTAPWIASELLNAPALTDALRISAILLLFNAVLGAQAGTLQGLEEFRTTTMLNTVRGVLVLFLGTLGVLMLGLAGAIWGMVAAAGVVVWISFVAIRRAARRAGLPERGRRGTVDRSLVLHYALPALLGGIVNLPVIWVANVLLAHQEGGYAELGLLNAAMQWRNVLMFLPATIAQAALPMLSGAIAARDGESDTSRVWFLSHGAAVAATYPLCVLLALGGTVLLAAYGESFTSGHFVLLGVVSSVMLMAAGGVQGTVLQAQGAMWFGFGINVLWSVIFLVGVGLGVSSFGAAAVSFSMAASYLVSTICVFVYLGATGAMPAGAWGLVLRATVFAAAVTALGAVLPTRAALLLAIPAALVTATLGLIPLTHSSFRESALRAAGRALARAGWPWPRIS